MDLGHDGEYAENIKEEINSQGVYVYKPPKTAKANGERPPKRRKVSKDNSRQEDELLPFLPLLGGKEKPELVQLRHRTFQQLWSEQEQRIQNILEDVDSDILEKVTSFIRTASPQSCGGRIPTALINIGSNVSSLGRLLDRLNHKLITAEEGGVVVLESGDASNLKTALKNIIRTAVTNTEGNEGYQKFLTDRAGPRLLGYDLELLNDYVKRRQVRKLVIAFRDSEAFDPGLLTDLLSLLSSWLDRIPFTLLFGIATSVELFEGRLARSTVALLQGRRFEIHDAGDSNDRVYEALQTNQDVRLWLGHNVTSVLFEKSRDYFQSPEAFGRTVKYAYMSHFFANSLAVLLSDSVSTNLSQSELCEAIRNLPSFRRLCEDLLDSGNPKQVRSLLNDDQFLLQEAKRHVKEGQKKMQQLFLSVKAVSSSLRFLRQFNEATISDLSVRALAGELQKSPTIEEILMAIKKLDSESLQNLLASLTPILVDSSELRTIQEDLQRLVESNKGVGPFRSEYDDRHLVMQTTVVEQRVKLSKAKAKLSSHEIEYTEIVDRFHATFEGLLKETLIKPQALALHEVFVFDLKHPLRDTFAPRSRFAIERALSTPFDYLISTSDDVEGNLSATQPTTAILYQLYLESGCLVNVYDLWRAFYTIIGGEEGEQYDERMAFTLFYRALSDLKLLGMVKSGRKKIDHIGKTAWKGL
ncbi:hypothetical protein VTN02DRAFT_2019 [Thermoascus thermophilus]